MKRGPGPSGRPGWTGVDEWPEQQAAVTEGEASM